MNCWIVTECMGFFPYILKLCYNWCHPHIDNPCTTVVGWKSGSQTRMVFCVSVDSVVCVLDTNCSLHIASDFWKQNTRYTMLKHSTRRTYIPVTTLRLANSSNTPLTHTAIVTYCSTDQEVFALLLWATLLYCSCHVFFVGIRLTWHKPYLHVLHIIYFT